MSPRAADKRPSWDLKHWWPTAQIIVALPRPKPLPLALPGSLEWKRSPRVRSAAGTATSPQAGQWPRRPRVCRSAERRQSFLSQRRPLQRKRQLGLFQGQDPKPSSQGRQQGRASSTCLRDPITKAQEGVLVPIPGTRQAPVGNSICKAKTG